jgi:chromosome segregation ATPase
MTLHKQRHGATILQSIHTAQVSSVPKTQRSAYLELYVLGREKGRLTQEMLALDARREVIDRHLKNISKQISGMQQEVAKEQQNASGIRTPGRPVKTVDINY